MHGQLPGRHCRELRVRRRGLIDQGGPVRRLPRPWFPAVDVAANKYGWQLYNWTKATCPPIDIPIFSPELGRNFTECETWRQNVLTRIQEVHPAMVVLAVARHYTSIYGFTPYSPQWLTGLAQMVTTIRQMGAKVVVIGPVPKPPVTVYDCLSQHLTDAPWPAPGRSRRSTSRACRA